MYSIHAKLPFCTVITIRIVPYRILLAVPIASYLSYRFIPYCIVLTVPYRTVSHRIYRYDLHYTRRISLCRTNCAVSQLIPPCLLLRSYLPHRKLYLQLSIVLTVPYHIVLALYRTVLTYCTVLIVLKRTFRIA